MERKATSAIMLTLLLTSMLTLIFNIRPVKAEPRTWTVDDDGPADFHTIQEAINAANPGDIIFVYSGKYNEHLTVSKSLRLHGEDKETTIINGNGAGKVVLITASDITICEFTIENSGSGYSDSGIYLEQSSNNIISRNIIKNNFLGLHSFAQVSYSTISENLITSNYIGIYLITPWRNVFSRNTIANNSQGGINLHYAGYNNITGDSITNNGGSGVYFDGYYNLILENEIAKNQRGIGLQDAKYNAIYHNNFISNTQQVYSEYSISVWDDGYPSGGNYWTDYVGVDANRDGIGDTPYVIDVDNRDPYPLMKPWTPLPSLRVDPKTYNASRVGEVFSVNITINDLDVGWRMSYVEFKLNYNDTVLDVLNVADGGFMKHFAEQYPQMPELYPWPPYFFLYFLEPGYVIVGIAIIHPPIWMRIYPEGSGTLVTITFKAAVGPEAQYALELVDTLLVDESFNEIPHNTEDGYYTWSPTHDVAMVSVEPSTSEVYIGQAVNVSVVVKNEGTIAETFAVTCKYESEGVEHLIGTQTVTSLEPNTNTTLTFIWTTTDITIHTLKAEIPLLVGETDIADNSMKSPVSVKVKIIGDVNDDNKVDIKDIAQAALSFGSYPSHPRWNTQADTNQDSKVDIKDIALIAKNFGKTYP